MVRPIPCERVPTQRQGRPWRGAPLPELSFDIPTWEDQIQWRMDQQLSIAEVIDLVSEGARQVELELQPGHLDVYEQPNADDGNALVVQVGIRRPNNQLAWTMKRLRFAQAIRDALLERGDQRYPLVEVFGPEEWAARNA